MIKTSDLKFKTVELNNSENEKNNPNDKIENKKTKINIHPDFKLFIFPYVAIITNMKITIKTKDNFIILLY